MQNLGRLLQSKDAKGLFKAAIQKLLLSLQHIQPMARAKANPAELRFCFSCHCFF